MCGVIGVSIRKITEAQIELITQVLRESRIRGKHATGVSYLKGGKLHTLKYPISSDKFLAKHSISDFVDQGNLTMIAHCRYSTSDLKTNQPLFEGGLSIVHNGVISQEPPNQWEKIYGYKTQTKNDTELLLRSVEQGKSPLSEWSEASIAAIELRKDKSLRFYRNGKRPLYKTDLGNGTLVTSTRDIVWRIDRSLDAVVVEPGRYHCIDQALNLSVSADEKARINDLQTIPQTYYARNFATKEEVETLLEQSPPGKNTKFVSSSHSLWCRFKNYEKNPPMVLRKNGEIVSLIFATFNRDRYSNLYEIVTVEGEEGKGYASRLWDQYIAYATANRSIERLKISCTPSSITWHLRNGLVFWAVDPIGSLRSDQPLFGTREEQCEFRERAVINPAIAAPVNPKVVEKLMKESLESHSFGSKKTQQVQEAIEKAGSYWLRENLFRKVDVV
jgi:hypothetical protein